MFARKTVFVIGAGCSFEYGFPVGSTLKNQIATMMCNLSNARRSQTEQTDPLLLDAVRSLAFGQDPSATDALGPWLVAAEEIARGMPHTPSIDRYLHFRRDDDRIVRLGKLAIVRSILAAEAQSSLVGTGLSHENISQRAGGSHWLGQLFTLMTEGVTSRARLSDAFRNLTFICFNYDRCIEHYFFQAVKELGSFNDSEAAEILAELDIIHPYGRVGGLPWANEVSDGVKVGFGTVPTTAQNLNWLSSEIKTFTEGEREADRTKHIHAALFGAERICFLGFSFLDQNMQLLTAHGTPAAEYFATVYGVSGDDQEIAHQLISRLGKGEGPGGDFTNGIHRVGQTAGRFLADTGNRLRR